MELRACTDEKTTFSTPYYRVNNTRQIRKHVWKYVGNGSIEVVSYLANYRTLAGGGEYRVFQKIAQS